MAVHALMGTKRYRMHACIHAYEVVPHAGKLEQLGTFCAGMRVAMRPNYAFPHVGARMRALMRTKRYRIQNHACVHSCALSVC